MLRMLSRPTSYPNIAEPASACINELQGLAASLPSPLSQVTRSQIMAAQVADPRLSTTLFFSAHDLWRHFVSTGERKILEVAAHSSHLAYLLSKETVHKRNALLSWAIISALDAIPIAEVQIVIDEIAEICALEGYSLDMLRMTTLVLEAHVGLVKSFRRAQDVEAAEQLLQTNQQKLQFLHDDYRRKTPDVPDSRKADEQEAWNFLLAAFPIANREETRARGSAILAHADLAAAIQTGAHTGVYTFVDHHYQSIQDQLQARLAVRFTPENALYPEGTVFMPRAQKTGSIHPMFEHAIRALKSGDLELAETMLSRLSKEINGRARDICNNFHAYVRGKQGELADARGMLRNLTDNSFEGPSAYWNYACFTPNDQPDLQIKVLSTGLMNSAHPTLLKGLLHLSLLLDDREQLRKWLPLLTFAEALLLSFYLEYDALTVDDRERAIVRLNIYRRSGEPAVPDPTSSEVPLVDINKFMNEMVERDQSHAFEFWLKCRPPRIATTLFHLSLVSDYFNRTNRRAESIAAFTKELRVRIGRLERGGWPPGHYIEARNRAEQWLTQSMTPAFRELGGDIFRMLRSFDSRDPAPLVRITPGSSRIREYFQSDSIEDPAAPIASPLERRPTVPTISGRPASIENRPSGMNAPSRDSILPKTAGDLYANMREIRTFSQNRLTVDRLASALDANSCPNCARSLRKMLGAWESYLRVATRVEKEEEYRAALDHFREFDANQHKEIAESHLAAKRQLSESFKNVNRSIARALELLPNVSVSPLAGTSLRTYKSGSERVVVICVRTNQEEPVCIASTRATTIGSQTPWKLLDPLEEFPVFASNSIDAILTLSSSSPSRPEREEIQFELSYKFGGDTVNTPATTLWAEEAGDPVHVEDSPFIYARKIDKSEIVDHFVGREKEQAAIIQSMSDSARPKICYVHGIRRSGKSSLLESIEYLIDREGLPLVPVAINLAFIGMKRHVGLLIHDILRSIAKKTGFPEELPSKEQCLDEPDRVLRDCLAEVVARLTGRRLVIILDDVQEIEQILDAFRRSDPVVFLGFVGFLNFIWQDARPHAPISWLLAGHRNWKQLQVGSPEVLLWNALKNVAVDFFDLDLVREAIRRPLNGYGIEVPDQTMRRVHELTAGYPEIVQMVGEKMFLRAREEARRLLTPFDAIEAARWVASSLSFETTWYPRAQLSDVQRSLMTAFVNAVSLGGSIEAFRLVRQRAITPEIEEAIRDLEYRQIITSQQNGTIKIKAHILELWLRNEVAREDLGRMSGSVAIFVDVANLTQGSGATLIHTPEGGAVQVVEVLKAIENLARGDSPAPRGPRWAVNYPPGAPAVAACHSMEYHIKNIPEELYRKALAAKGRKGADDVVLREQISEVEQDWPRVTNYFVVTGDIDYSLTINRLLSNGKTVSLVSWRGARNSAYDSLKSAFPDRFFDKSIEAVVGLA